MLEDEFLIAMDVEMLCRDHGAADVIIKRNLDEFDGSDNFADFDVAIIDLMLSNVSTLPFAKRLAKAGRPFIFASGYVEVDEVLKAFPGVPVIGKPYAGTDLVNAVAQRAPAGARPAQAADDPSTCVEIASGPKSASPEIFRISWSRARALLTRLLIVPTAHPQISAASS